MVKCPKCGYTLVLLEYKSKYKCAKCGRLFPQQKIDVKEFQYYNKNERIKDKEAIEIVDDKRYKQPKLSEFERKQRSLALAKAWRKEHAEEMREFAKKYYYKNKDNILKRQRHYRLANGQRRNERLKWLRSQKLEEYRLNERIKYWRKKQVLLAQELIEIGLFEGYSDGLSNSLPTFELPNLLILAKDL